MKSSTALANRDLFETRPTLGPTWALSTNEAGGKAYEPTTHQALAGRAVTGCLNGTCYANVPRQLEAGRRGMGTDLGPCDELDRWCNLAREAAATRGVGPIGIVKLWAGDAPSTDLGVDRIPPEPERLRRLVPSRPTLLDPAAARQGVDGVAE